MLILKNVQLTPGVYISDGKCYICVTDSCIEFGEVSVTGIDN